MFASSLKYRKGTSKWKRQGKRNEAKSGTSRKDGRDIIIFDYGSSTSSKRRVLFHIAYRMRAAQEVLPFSHRKPTTGRAS